MENGDSWGSSREIVLLANCVNLVFETTFGTVKVAKVANIANATVWRSWPKSLDKPQLFV
jgi:hypothetical protein